MVHKQSSRGGTMNPTERLRKQLAVMLIAKAIEKHGPAISKCYGKLSFSDSVTEFRGKVQLWYNTPDNSTHIVTLRGEE